MTVDKPEWYNPSQKTHLIGSDLAHEPLITVQVQCNGQRIELSAPEQGTLPSEMKKVAVRLYHLAAWIEQENESR